MKTALITGVTGQDGSYLAELLLAKGYRVVGVVRRSSSFNTARIDHLIDREENFFWERSDLQDANSLANILLKYAPHEIYHLAAQSHVGVSFDLAEYTMDVGLLGTLRLLEAIRINKLDCKMYNAGSSEMFGAAPAPQSETSNFMPQSPYAIAKVASHQLVQLYRDAYSMQLFNGILFNHESPRRGETFVTRKITKAVARIFLSRQRGLELGNLDAVRDWGSAGDYVEAMWKILQTDRGDDYVIATGVSISVRDFVERAFKVVGIELTWMGSGLDEKGVVSRLIPGVVGDFGSCDSIEVGDVVVSVSEKYFRPAEVHNLKGDASKAKAFLNWRPSMDIDALVDNMVMSDLSTEYRAMHGEFAIQGKA